MYTDVMVDLETTGTSPERTAIIQIAAVKFNLETGAVCATDMFNRCLNLPGWRYWAEDTRSWWMTSNRGVLETIFPRMEDPRIVFEDFCKWAYPAGSLRFWGKPTHFDFSFIQSYARDYGMPMPFHYRTANDLNSWLRGRYFPDPVPNLEVEFVGKQHDAIFDVLHQIKVLLAYYEATKTQVLTAAE